MLSYFMSVDLRSFEAKVKPFFFCQLFAERVDERGKDLYLMRVSGITGLTAHFVTVEACAFLVRSVNVYLCNLPCGTRRSKAIKMSKENGTHYCHSYCLFCFLLVFLSLSYQQHFHSFNLYFIYCAVFEVNSWETYN